MNIHTLSFSPTGTSKKVAKGIAQGTGYEHICHTDMTFHAPAVKAYVKINHNPSGVLTINEKIDKYREKE